jgi:FGGY-family pentulose kinase
MSGSPLFLGVDVGTGSARAGVFDAHGALIGAGSAPIALFTPEPDMAQHSSADIWRAICAAVRDAVRGAGCDPATIRGIGVDATCSLVAVGANGAPVSVSPDGAPEQDTIVWMDHRAIAQAARIDATGHPLLRFTGGTMSPEMQLPKLMWLRDHLAPAFESATQFFDLPDWITWRATGSRTRSLCSVTCKWTYQGSAGLAGEGWDDAFLQDLGLGSLTRDNHAPIGNAFAPPGAPVGRLGDAAAAELGLAPGTPVAASLIDAYAGALGTLAAADPDSGGGRLALIAGTSACHIANTPDARFVPGVWGPYLGALGPTDWANEAGQSAAGALIDRIIAGHGAAAQLASAARDAGDTVIDRLDAILARLSPDPARRHLLAADVHVLPDFHGNRAPLADPEFRGAITGLTLDCGADDLAITYLAALQALAYGTRQILAALGAQGVPVHTLVVSGGLARNRLYLQQHADATGCDILVPAQQEPVLLGGAMLGAVASGHHAALSEAQAAMSGPATRLSPQGGAARAYHDAKYAVFLKMQEDFRAYRTIMHDYRSTR